jgi:hypothetical protein
MVWFDAAQCKTQLRLSEPADLQVSQCTGPWLPSIRRGCCRLSQLLRIHNDLLVSAVKLSTHSTHNPTPDLEDDEHAQMGTLACTLHACHDGDLMRMAIVSHDGLLI